MSCTSGRSSTLGLKRSGAVWASAASSASGNSSVADDRDVAAKADGLAGAVDQEERRGLVGRADLGVVAAGLERGAGGRGQRRGAARVGDGAFEQPPGERLGVGVGGVVDDQAVRAEHLVEDDAERLGHPAAVGVGAAQQPPASRP